MSSGMSDARARAIAREEERQRHREQRKREAAKRRSRANSAEDDPNDPLAAERRIWRSKQKEKAGDTSNPFGGDSEFMTQEDQMIAHAHKLQSENQATLKNTIKVARETTQVGASTINKLNEQTEQFERMDNALNETNDSLSRSERVLRGMKSIGGAIGNMFSSGKSKAPKSLPPGARAADPASAQLEEKDRLRQRQRAMEDDKKRAKYPGASPSSFDTPASSLRPPGGASYSPDDDSTSSPAIQPSAKQQAALSSFERNQREEDEQLEELGDVLGALKEQSQVINQQLRTQAQIIDTIDSKVDHTGARLQKGTNTMKKIS